MSVTYQGSLWCFHTVYTWTCWSMCHQSD
jgi:hypothetical protein